MITLASFQTHQLEVFPNRMRLTRVDSLKKMRRFYALTVQPNLFGGVSLVREWGRTGSPGQMRIDHHRDEGHAINALVDLEAAKRNRGYHYA